MAEEKTIVNYTLTHYDLLKMLGKVSHEDIVLWLTSWGVYYKDIINSEIYKHIEVEKIAALRDHKKGLLEAGYVSIGEYIEKRDDTHNFVKGYIIQFARKIRGV